MKTDLLLREADDPVASKLFVTLDIRARFTYLTTVFRTEHADALKAMAYESFLRTVYWIVVRDYFIATRTRICAGCHGQRHLQVHHLSYDSHGLEHCHLEDLQILCADCHASIHNPILAELKAVIAHLAECKDLPHKALVVENPNYDPRTIMNLHDHGDIRGRMA